MTRKHYILIAKALAESKPNPAWLLKTTQWESDVRHIARELKHDNPRFDFSRFYSACGMEN